MIYVMISYIMDALQIWYDGFYPNIQDLHIKEICVFELASNSELCKSVGNFVKEA